MDLSEDYKKMILLMFQTGHSVWKEPSFSSNSSFYTIYRHNDIPYRISFHRSITYLTLFKKRYVCTIVFPNLSIPQWLDGISCEFDDIYTKPLWKSCQVSTELSNWFKNNLDFEVKLATSHDYKLIWIICDKEDIRMEFFIRPCYSDETWYNLE